MMWTKVGSSPRVTILSKLLRLEYIVTDEMVATISAGFTGDKVSFVLHLYFTFGLEFGL